MCLLQPIWWRCEELKPSSCKPGIKLVSVTCNYCVNKEAGLDVSQFRADLAFEWFIAYVNVPVVRRFGLGDQYYVWCVCSENLKVKRGWCVQANLYRYAFW